MLIILFGDYRDIVFHILLYAIIIAVTAWFVVSLVKFRKADKENIKDYKTRRFFLVISAVLFGVVILPFIAYLILLALVIANM